MKPHKFDLWFFVVPAGIQNIFLVLRNFAVDSRNITR